MKKDIVIGNSLKAVLFAHYKQYPLILSSPRGPFRFDEIDVAIPTFPTKNEFEKAYVFEDDKLTVQNEIIDQKEENFKVLDWMNVRSGAVHGLSRVDTEDHFIKSLHFYKSKRIDGNHNKKDLVAVSYLNKAQLSTFDYSDTMAKFKTENLMRKNGIKGAKSGLDSHGKPKRYNIKIEPDYREVLPIGNIVYKDSTRVVFPKLTIKEIVEKYA